MRHISTLSDEELSLIHSIVDSACNDITYHLGISSNDAIKLVRASLDEVQAENDDELAS